MASTGVGVAGRVGFYCAHIEGYLVMSVGASMELASGMHRDADGRHRHAQPWNLARMGTSRPVCTRLWVKPSATPSRTSVCVPPRMPCVSRHIKPDHARATIAPERARTWPRKRSGVFGVRPSECENDAGHFSAATSPGVTSLRSLSLSSLLPSMPSNIIRPT